MTELEQRVDTLEKKVKVLEDLEKRLALAVLDVMPTTTHNVSGYDITSIRTAMGMRWVWRHFLRGARSAATFETREACVKSAQADSLKHIAFPNKDIEKLVNKEQIERAPHPHRLNAARAATLAPRTSPTRPDVTGILRTRGS